MHIKKKGPLNSTVSLEMIKRIINLNPKILNPCPERQISALKISDMFNFEKQKDGWLLKLKLNDTVFCV